MFKRETARRRINDVGKRHFVDDSGFKPLEYEHRLNFYTTPPTEEVTLDQFEQWAISRLKGMPFLLLDTSLLRTS